MIYRKKYSTAQLKMLRGIINFAYNAGNVAITNSIASLLAVFLVLKGLVADIDDLVAQYSEVITGWAKEKSDARTALAISTYPIVKGVRAYAIANGDWTLANDVKTSLSVLKRMGYETMLGKVNGWITKVGPLVATLGDYNVTPAMYTQWQADRDALTALMTSPREAISAHSAIGTAIESKMKDAMTLTKDQIDEIVSTLLTTQPAYYTTYFNNRKIVGPGSRHTKFEATIVNEVGEPVWNATVTVDEINHTAKDGNTTTYMPVSATTTVDGRAVVNKFFACARTVTVSGPGIVSKTFGPFPFVHGETITQTLTVQPSFDNLPQSKETTEPTETTTTETGTTTTNS